MLLSHPVVSNSLRPHGLQPPCPWPSAGVCPSSCLLHWWYHPAISSSDALFSFCPQSSPAFPRLTEFCQEKALVITNTPFQQHKRWLCTWTSSVGQYWNQIDYILCSWRCRSSIQTAKTRFGVECCSDHQLLKQNLRLKLKKVGKTTRPLKYDLNQIPYDYTVEVTSRIKGLGLENRLPKELWTEVLNIA